MLARRLLAGAAAAVGVLVIACSGGAAGGGGQPAGGPSPAVAAASGGTGSSAAPNPPAPVVVTTGQVGTSATTWPVYVAEAEGFFEREGVQLDKTTFANGNAVLQAVAGGSIDTGFVGADLTVLGVEQGAPLSIVGGGYNRLVYTMVAQPSITSVRELAGKAVGVGGLRTSDALTVRRLLAHAGLTDDDYYLTTAATSNDRLAALKSGIVAAAVLTQPSDFQAADEGFRVLARSTEIMPDYQFITLVAYRPWAAQHEEALVRLLRAYADAARWLDQPANKERAIEILVEATRTQPKYARHTYELYVEQVKALTTNGAPNLPGIQTAIDLLGEAGDIAPPFAPPSKYVDERYLQKAQGR